MKCKSFLLNLVILLSIIFKSFIIAQDSLKIIILSDEIGPTVDKNERNEYNIFPNFRENFISAIFYVSPDTQYFCIVKLKEGDSFKDSTFLLNSSSIHNTAFRIQNLENMKKDLPQIEISTFGDLYPKKKIIKSINLLQKDSLLNSQEISFKSDNLPIFRKELDYSKIIERKSTIGFSFGIIYHSKEFKGLNKIFNLLEESIPTFPYEIPKSKLKIKSSQLLRFSSYIILRKSMMTEVEYSFNIYNKYNISNFENFSISLSYLFPMGHKVTVYPSIGYSATKITVIKHYNTIIDDFNRELKSISLIGITKGFHSGFGIIYNLSSNLFIDIKGSYNFHPKAKVIPQTYELPNNVPEVDFNEFGIGLSIYVVIN